MSSENGNGSQTTAIVRAKPRRMTVAKANAQPQRVTLRRMRPREFQDRTPVKFVDYHANWTDYLCYALAALGRTNKAIAKVVNLTESQVQYRITKVEKERGKATATMRAQYRNGKGPIAEAVASVLTQHTSPVRREITQTLEKRNLYAPRPKGVLRDERN